jgi:hypothetical protein
MNALGAEEVYVHPFLTSALDGSELSASRLGFFTPEKRPWYAWDNNLLPLPEIEPSSSVSSYPLYRLRYVKPSATVGRSGRQCKITIGEGLCNSNERCFLRSRDGN